MNGIFIHIPKAAGTTIYKHTLDVAPRVWKHGTALAIKNRMDSWDDLFTFAFVRNPWQRFASWYLHCSEYGTANVAFKRCVMEDNILIDNHHSPDVKYRNPITQETYLTDLRGNVLVDFIGKVENFDSDFRIVCDKLGLDYNWKTRNVSSPYDYREMYDDESREALGEKCRWEIKKFGYNFEGQQWEKSYSQMAAPTEQVTASEISRASLSGFSLAQA